MKAFVSNFGQSFRKQSLWQVGIVTQASLQLQQFVNHLWHQGNILRNSPQLRQWTRRIESSKGWLLSFAILLLLWIWNWRLVLSGGAGLTTWVVVYLILQGQWQLPKLNWQSLWKSSNRPLILGISSGAIVCCSTYLALAIWNESGGSWLAKGLILEGLGILAILLLLIWHSLSPSLNHQFNHNRAFDQWLIDLSDADALKRMIAVRRLTQAMVQSSTLPLSAMQLAECFRLMLNRETEPAVCRALLDSLQTLNPNPGNQVTRSLQAGQSLPFSAPVQPRSTVTQNSKNTTI